MENIDNILDSELLVDEEVEDYLKQTALWAKYIAVLGFIFSGFSAIRATVSAVKMITTHGGRYFNTITIFTGILVPCLSVAIYFAISLFSFRFAISMQEALALFNQMKFNVAWQNLRMAYRIIGILFIIYIAIVLIAFVFMAAIF